MVAILSFTLFEIVTMSDSRYLSLAWLEKEVKDLTGLGLLFTGKSEDVGGSNSERSDVRFWGSKSIY